MIVKVPKVWGKINMSMANLASYGRYEKSLYIYSIVRIDKLLKNKLKLWFSYDPILSNKMADNLVMVIAFQDNISCFGYFLYFENNWYSVDISNSYFYGVMLHKERMITKENKVNILDKIVRNLL